MPWNEYVVKRSGVSKCAAEVDRNDDDDDDHQDEKDCGASEERWSC